MKERKEILMENQYNYYNPQGQPGNQQPGENKKKKKKMPKAIAVTGLALLFGLVSSATFISANIVGNKIFRWNQASEKTVRTSSGQIKNNASLTQTSSVVTSDVSAIVDEVMPSVVSITNMSVQQVQDFFGGVYEQNSESAGTGIIIAQNDEELLIVTNNHVIEGSDTLTVTFHDNTSVEAALKGTDAAHDLAVMAVPLSSISDETKEEIAVAKLGDSTKLKAGEPAIAIGNALGYGQSVTTGVISATDRSSSQADAENGETTEAEQSSDVKLIQTDAAINPGNSGGALVNASGEVIGINSSKLVGETVEGVGYAIPISDVSDIITDLMNQETKTKVDEDDQGVIGITGFDVTQEYAQQFNMPVGVYISEVAKGGGAAQAGLTKGSIITGLNGSAITSMETLKNELQYYEKGDKVTLTVQIPESNGEYTEEEMDVVLGRK